MRWSRIRGLGACLCDAQGEIEPESTYGREEDELAIPINAVATEVLEFGGQRIGVGGGLRYGVEGSRASPAGHGFRFIVTFLLK